jgi:hypothetical protein
MYYVVDGKFQWSIQGHEVMMYPGDAALILPGQTFGSATGILEIGTLSWLHLHIVEDERGALHLGKWSSLSVSERLTMSKILMLNQPIVLSKFCDAARILGCLQHELFNHEIGFCTRINQMLDELLIVTTRHLTKQSNCNRDFPKAFLQLEERLRKIFLTNGLWKKWLPPSAWNHTFQRQGKKLYRLHSN